MKPLLLLFVAVAANAATLGSRKCSHGPAYWCGTINQAKECGAVQYCLDNHWPNIKTMESSFCTDCQAGISYLREELSKASTENEIVQYVEKFCKDLGTLAEDCKLVVDAYGPEVLKALIQELKPEQVCALMGFCKGETVIADQEKDNSAEILALVMTKSSSKVMKLLLSQVEGTADQCTDCTNFFGDVKNILNNATVEQMITSEIEMVCNYLGPYKDECKLIVSTLVPQGIGQLVQKFVPKQVCTEIGFCKSSLLGTDDPVPEPPPNDPCSDCKAFMGDVKTLLSNDTVQKMIIQELQSLCNSLGSFAPQCQQYVSQYGPLVFGVALQYFDPNMVCGYLGFCKAEEVPRTLLFTSNDVCSDCTTIVADVTTLLKDPNVQTAIIHQLEHICDDLGSLGPQCKLYVDQYAPLVFNIALQYLTPSTVCSALGLCSGEQEPEALPEPGDICTDCQNFVRDFDALLNNYTVQEKLLKDLLVLCKYVPNYQSECEQYLPQYGGLVFEVIAGLLNPKTICKDVGICQVQTDLNAEDVPLSSPDASDPCSECEAIFKDISTLLQDTAFQKMIISNVETLCKDLGTLSPICKNYVEQYGPLVFNYLAGYIVPKTICTTAGLCSGGLPKWLVNIQLPEVDGDLCTDCKALVNDADGLLKNATVQVILALVDVDKMFLNDLTVVCKYFGGLSGECKQVILEYGPLLFDLLANYIDPTTICDEIGLCPSLIKLGADQCKDCTAFFQDVSTIVNTPSVQKMILQEIENLCNDLGSLGPQCQQYVSEYGPLVINFLLQYLDPSAICKDIGFCSGTCQTPKLFSVNADQCTDCKNFFQDVSTILNKPSTQQMILQGIENLCNDLGSLGPQCQQYVSEYGPLVINFLLQYLDPSSICGEIGFCPAVSRPPMNLVSVNADQCSDCKIFFQDVSTLLNKPSTQQMILQDIENLCNDLGSLGPQCQQYVSEYGPLVINFLLQYLDPSSICADIGFCSSLSLPPPVNADDCSDCKNFFQDVSTILNNATVQNMILKDIGNLCNDLGSLGPQCQQYVQQYGPLVINFLLQYLDPSAICTDIGFCNGTCQTPKLFSVNADQCTDCKNFFQDVSTILNKPSTQQMILQGIENLCNDLGSLGPQCQQYVSEYGPLVINFLLQYLDPSSICGEIGFCSAVSRPPMNLVSVNADQCTDCKNFFQDVSTILNNPSTQNMILKDIQNLCNDLGNLGPQCQQYVQQYGPLVINFLLQYLDPTAICGDIGFCSAVSKPPIKIVGVNADQCTDCKNFFSDVSQILNDPSTQTMILQDIKNLCNDLGSLGPQCQQYVSEYGPLVINFLLQYLDPTSICGDIGFCPSLTTIPATELVAAHPISRLDQTPPVDSPVACQVCKMVVEKVEVLLKDKATEAEITAALEKFCSVLPSSLANQCQAFVHQYGPVIIQLLVNQMDPQEVCSYIRLCRNDQELQYQASPLCTVCEFAMSELDKIVLDPTSISDVQAALDKLCSLLPATVVDSCQSFVNTYTETIVQLIVQQVSPKLVCRAVGVCAAQESTFAVQKYEFGLTCPMCIAAIRWLEKEITKESTMAQIENLLENVCSFVPQQKRSQCITFVDTYTPEIIGMLVRFASPRMVCRLMQMCLLEEAPIPEPQVQAGEFCEICEFAMSELDKLLTQPSTEAEIEQALNQVCSFLPATVSDTCKSFVSQYTREIIFLIAQSISPQQVCTALTLCTSDTGDVWEEKSPVPEIEENLEASTECIVCEFAFRELEAQLKKNATEKEIKAALQKVCTLLPESLAEDCNLLISYYTTEVIYQFLRKYPANKVCTLLRVCAEVDGEMTAVTHLNDVGADPECAICEVVAKELEKTLQKNSTEAAIKKTLDSLCGRLPSTITKDCQMFVDYYTEEIIFILVSQFPPDKICSSLQLCDIADVQVLKVEPEATESKASSASCELCQYAMKYLESVLSQNATEAEIEAALEKVCSFVPSSYRAECDYFVQQYTSEIVKLILSEISPSEVCSALGLCSSVEESKAISVSCELCQYAMKYLESMLSQNATEAEIEAALEKVCSLVPSSYRAECDYFVQQYTSEIVKLILSEVSPSEVCSALGLCSSVEDDPSISCEVCVIAVRNLELYITKNSTEQEIDKILENLCKQFPGNLQEQCVSFVQSFGNAIPELIVTFADPDKVCTLLDVCSKEEDLKYSLFERCKTGPEFWCATQANADLCNAVEHCKRHVWN